MQVTSQWRNCVTCERWAGPRKLSSFRDRVEYGSDVDAGECVGGVFDRQKVSPMVTCDKWVKWSLLQ